MLALEAGRVVSADRLAEGLWGERPAGERGQDGPAVRLPPAPGAGRHRGGDRHARAWLRAAARRRRARRRALRAPGRAAAPARGARAAARRAARATCGRRAVRGGRDPAPFEDLEAARAGAGDRGGPGGAATRRSSASSRRWSPSTRCTSSSTASGCSALLSLRPAGGRAGGVPRGEGGARGAAGHRAGPRAAAARARDPRARAAPRGAAGGGERAGSRPR